MPSSGSDRHEPGCMDTDYGVLASHVEQGRGCKRLPRPDDAGQAMVIEHQAMGIDGTNL
jgi:hypothetical protein